MIFLFGVPPTNNSPSHVGWSAPMIKHASITALNPIISSLYEAYDVITRWKIPWKSYIENIKHKNFVDISKCVKAKGFLFYLS